MRSERGDVSVTSPGKKGQPVNNRESQLQKLLDSKEILPERVFHRMISLEEKRSKRTQRPFALLFMNAGRTLPFETNAGPLLSIVPVLQAHTRETDLIGWYETNVSVGVMFTEITVGNDLILSTILSRINATLRTKLTPEQLNRIKGSCVLVPEELGRIYPVSEKNVGLPVTYVVGAAAGWGRSPE
jgi:hypothetical protein